MSHPNPNPSKGDGGKDDKDKKVKGDAGKSPARTPVKSGVTPAFGPATTSTAVANPLAPADIREGEWRQTYDSVNVIRNEHRSMHNAVDNLRKLAEEHLRWKAGLTPVDITGIERDNKKLKDDVALLQAAIDPALKSKVEALEKRVGELEKANKDLDELKKLKPLLDLLPLLDDLKKVKGLPARVDKLDTGLRELTNTTVAHTKAIAATDTRVLSLDTRVTDNENDIKENADAIAALRKQMEEHTRQIKDLGANLKVQADKLAAVETTVGRISIRLEEIAAKIAAYEKQLKELEELKKALKLLGESLSLRMDGQDDKINGINKTIAGIETQITGINVTIRKLNTEVETHTTALEKLDKVVAGHTANINTLTTLTTRHTGEITDLGRRIRDLEPLAPIAALPGGQITAIANQAQFMAADHLDVAALHPIATLPNAHVAAIANQAPNMVADHIDVAALHPNIANINLAAALGPNAAIIGGLPARVTALEARPIAAAVPGPLAGLTAAQAAALAAAADYVAADHAAIGRHHDVILNAFNAHRTVAQGIAKNFGEVLSDKGIDVNSQLNWIQAALRDPPPF